MANYKTPGVYIKEIPKFPPSVAQVETAIPAFIGHTEKAISKGEDLTLNPTRITSLLEYETYFGGPQAENSIVVTLAQEVDAGDVVIAEELTGALSGATPSAHLMYYALQMYFANGGGPCYIVSVGAYLAVGDAIPLVPLQDGLATLLQEDEPTLIVFPEGQGMAEPDYYTLQNDSLAQCNKLQDRFAIMDMHNNGGALANSGEVLDAATAFRNGVTSSFLKYGAVYFPNVKSVFNYSYDETTVAIAHQVTAADGVVAAGALDGQTMDSLVGTDDALYSKMKLAIDSLPITLPPSSTMAGIYAQVDSNRGVWKAPANVGVNAVESLTFKVTNDIQDFLNVDTTAGKSINVIRPFTGKGILVWGSRTLAGNDNEWRYIPVRRFFNMVEESVKKATEQFVFEPNDANTWTKVRGMISNFLVLQWRAGALAGPTPEAAFYVSIGLGETMTALDILEGRMIVEIGMAAVRPAEFIILKFSHKMQEA
ncbi:phage tail sheath C-terminal domain-containing protein [Flammeovirgaceae bacterium SG7u.111]|nr:phage tail sheath C-terminal domain-containing protein [Flammeovirgaceae bacterium SG7u.132]WPO36477.1 phage tail sheath C-terminal domain-containing protein [Flammeovirgaceae bacterium SG7u.111]